MSIASARSQQKPGPDSAGSGVPHRPGLKAGPYNPKAGHYTAVGGDQSASSARPEGWALQPRADGWALPPKAGPYTAPGTSSPTARISASALLRVTGPGLIR